MVLTHQSKMYPTKWSGIAGGERGGWGRWPVRGKAFADASAGGKQEREGSTG